MPGTLFVVATPIGNLEDVTLRALRTLREVDLIAAEDTRRTAKLLAHYEIRRPLTSLHEHNEHHEIPKLLARLQAGSSIALVTDAGTPGIADPGARLVRAVREHRLAVTAIPGPSAVTAALSISGMSADQFVFLGFPPPSGAARERWLSELAGQQRLAVFFEAPHRIDRTLADVALACVKRPINIIRELTKIHEELVVWPSETPIKEAGEFVVLVDPGEVTRKHASDLSADDAFDLFGRLTNKSGMSDELATRVVGFVLGTDASSARRLIKRGQIAIKRRHQPSP